LFAARESCKVVNMSHFERAKDKIMMGAERRSMVMTEEEKKMTAYHESGHAILGCLFPSDPVHKVTIIPRGRALGLTQQLPEEDRYNMSKSYALDRIAILFGGRIAEKLFFDEVTTGAGNDLEVATDLARKMVCEWGMSEKLGPLTFGKKEEAIFLGREIAQHQEYSEQTAVDIDAEVSRIIKTQYERAAELVELNQEALKRVAEALIEYETLDGNEIQALMDGKGLTREPPKVKMPTREEIERKRKEKEEAKAKAKDTILGPLKPSEV
jgi:cell division protease FtsH